jgi:hypothetical protein
MQQSCNKQLKVKRAYLCIARCLAAEAQTTLPHSQQMTRQVVAVEGKYVRSVFLRILQALSTAVCLFCLLSVRQMPFHHHANALCKVQPSYKVLPQAYQQKSLARTIFSRTSTRCTVFLSAVVNCKRKVLIRHVLQAATRTCHKS